MQWVSIEMLAIFLDAASTLPQWSSENCLYHFPADRTSFAVGKIHLGREWPRDQLADGIHHPLQGSLRSNYHFYFFAWSTLPFTSREIHNQLCTPILYSDCCQRVERNHSLPSMSQFQHPPIDSDLWCCHRTWELHSPFHPDLPVTHSLHARSARSAPSYYNIINCACIVGLKGISYQHVQFDHNAQPWVQSNYLLLLHPWQELM